MEYAYVQNKHLTGSWKKPRTKNRGKTKKGKAAFKIKSVKNAWDRFKTNLRNASVFTIKSALIFGFVYGLFYAYHFLTSTEKFAVAEIQIEGTKELNQHKIIDWTGPIEGKNIFKLDLGNLAETLRKHPWIHEASVERILPRGVTIHLKERSPYARIKLDRTYILDNYGVVLGATQPRFDHLPLIIGLPTKPVQPGENVVTGSIIHGLHTMYYFNKLEFFQTDPIDTFQIMGAHRVKFTTRHRKLMVLLDLNSLHESFENFKILLETLLESPDDIEYIDLSFKNQIVVKTRKPQKVLSKPESFI